LDRNRLRKATLVRGFRVSWAGTFLCLGGAAGGRPEGLQAIPREPSESCPASPWVAAPSRLPAGRTVPREPSGAACRWATRLQPNVAPVATAPRQSTHHQYSNHTVTVVRGDRPSGSPTEGSGLSRGGTPWGDNRSSEEVRRPSRGRRTEISGGTDGPVRRTFRSLKLLAFHTPQRSPSCLSGLSQHASAPRHGTPPPTAPR
jgi:hypothetical protein